jgi:hypothetical protein
MQGRSMRDSLPTLKAYRRSWMDRWHEYAQSNRRPSQGGLKMHPHMQEMEWLLDVRHCCERCPVWWLEYARRYLFGEHIDLIEDMFDEGTRCPFGEYFFPYTEIYYLVTSRHLCGSCYYTWTQSTIHTKRAGSGPAPKPFRHPECCPFFDPFEDSDDDDDYSSDDDDEDSDEEEFRRPTSLPRSVFLALCHCVPLFKNTEKHRTHSLLGVHEPNVMCSHVAPG